MSMLSRLATMSSAGAIQAPVIQYVGAYTSTNATAEADVSFSLTSLTGGLASAPSVGDLVVVCVSTGSSSGSGNTPSVTTGYTTVADAFADDSNSAHLFIAYKLLTAADTTVTVNGGAGGTSSSMAVYISVWRNVDTTYPVDILNAATASSANSVLANPPAITPVDSGSCIIAVGAGGYNSAFARTYGSSDLTDFRSSGIASDLYDAVIGGGYSRWTGGSFDPAEFTFSTTDSTAFAWCAATFAIRPAGSVAPYPVFVSSSTARSAAATLSIAAPSGIQDGDLLVALLLTGNGGSQYPTSLPSGFVCRYESTYWTVATKIASGESGSYAFGWVTTTANSGAILVYRYADEFALHASSVSTNTAAGITFPSITPTFDGTLITVSGIAVGGATVTTPPTGMTQRALYNSLTPNFAVYDSTPSPASTISGKSITWSSNSAKSALALQIGRKIQATPPFAISSSEKITATSTSLVIDKPIGTRENDLMVAYVAGGGTGNTWTGGGWVELADMGSSPYLRVAYRVVTASEPSNWTFTASASGNIGGAIVTYRNAVYDAIGSPVSLADPLQPSAPTPTSVYELLTGVVARTASTGTYTSIKNTSAVSLSTAPTFRVVESVSVEGNAGSSFFTNGASATGNGAQLMLLKPAASYMPYAAHIASNKAGGTGTVATISVNTPACVPGNLLLFAVCPVSTATATVATPAGWTQLVGLSAALNVPGIYIFYRVADGTEATSFTATMSASAPVNASITCLAGVDAHTLTAGSVNIPTLATSATAAAVSPTGASNNIVLDFCAAVNANSGIPTVTLPTGYTTIVNQSFNGTSVDGVLNVSYQEGVAAGSTGSKTSTLSIGSYSRNVLVWVAPK